MMAETDVHSAARRKRVQILKRIIIASLLTSILLPTVLCIVLFVKVQALEKQIVSLTERIAKEAEVQVETSGGNLAENGGGQGFIVEPESTVTKPPETVPESEEDVKEEPETEQATVRKIYLTFDDGPSSNTDDILDILAEYDVKATFFVVGKEGEWAEEAYRRIVDEGHTLAMHSYTHQYDTIYASVESYAEDLSRLQEYLYEITGVWCRYVRFPGGSSNTVSDVDMKECIAYLNAQGLTYFDWNVSSQDATRTALSEEQFLDNCLTGVAKHQDTVIILMHDAASKKTTVEALPALIEALRDMEDTELLPITDDTVPVQHIKITQDETEE